MTNGVQRVAAPMVGAQRVAAPMARQAYNVERPTHLASGPRPVERQAHVVSGAHSVERPAHLVSGAHSVQRPAPVHQSRGPRPFERQAHVEREQQVSEHVVEEYTTQGPILDGPHDATFLTGDRLSDISGLPGRDAGIPFGPPSTYVPSYSDAGTFEIGSANPAT
jgi:hypothetical protein